MPPPSLRVLVIDHDRAHAESIAEALANNGHEIAVAESATEALAIAKRRSPEVVVLDVTLPDANGYEVASVLRRDVVPKCLIIALSNLGESHDVPTSHDPDSYIDLHLTKPVDGAQLSSLINYVYAKRT